MGICCRGSINFAKNFLLIQTAFSPAKPPYGRSHMLCPSLCPHCKPSFCFNSLSDSPALISCGFQIHIFKNSPTFFSKTLDKPLQKCGDSRLLVKKVLFIPAQPVSIFDWRRFLCYLLIMAAIPPIRTPSYLNF